MELRPESGPMAQASGQLLERVRVRDAEAMAELVAAYDGEMVRLCFVVCADRELARDATQNAWYKLWNDPPRLRDAGKLRSWLLTVAANEARQAMRRRRAGRVKEMRVESMRAERAGDDVDLHIDLRAALRRLTAEERELLGLRYVVGLNSIEIGEHLGLSREGARSRLHRVIRRLREELARE